MQHSGTLVLPLSPPLVDASTRSHFSLWGGTGDLSVRMPRSLVMEGIRHTFLAKTRQKQTINILVRIWANQGRGWAGVCIAICGK